MLASKQIMFGKPPLQSARQWQPQERIQLSLPLTAEDMSPLEERSELAFGCVDWFMYGSEAPELPT